jgi:predicted amidohydrolase YtcJ
LTVDAAYASFSDDIVGSLSVGKRADFVVLSKDIMTIPSEQIPDVTVAATIIDGEVVYGNL